jgi:hypothetical protein
MVKHEEPEEGDKTQSIPGTWSSTLAKGKSDSIKYLVPIFDNES